MKSRNREVKIFNMSLLDILCGALGAFCFLMLALFPYYNSGSGDAESQRLQRELVEVRQAIEKEKADQAKPPDGAKLAAENRDLQRQLEKVQAEIQQLMAEKQGAESGTAKLVPFALPNLLYVDICCSSSFQNLVLELPDGRKQRGYAPQGQNIVGNYIFVDHFFYSIAASRGNYRISWLNDQNAAPDASSPFSSGPASSGQPGMLDATVWTPAENFPLPKKATSTGLLWTLTFGAGGLGR